MVTVFKTSAVSTRFLSLTGAMSIALVGLSGCDEAILLTDAATNPSDQCSVYRKTIADARQSDIQQQQNAAVAGALIGALAGAAIGGGGNRFEGALLGAGAGAALGVGSTYYQQKAQRAADSQALLASVNGDAKAERAVVTETGRATVALRDCRSAQLSGLSKRVRSGTVETAAARAELNSIKKLIEQDNQIISAAFNGIGERVNDYVDATATVASTNQSISTASARAATPAVAAVSADQKRVMSSDERARSRLESEINAIEVLLG